MRGHPSLPRPPHLPPTPSADWAVGSSQQFAQTHQSSITQAGQGYFHSSLTVNAGAQFQSPYSSHYAKAYAQQQQQLYAGPSTTNDIGYSYSPIYVPSSVATDLFASSSTQIQPLPRPQSHGSWYQPGNSRCTHPGCLFMGSHKSVQTHMMDRHLIFPPGWKTRDLKGDWDADPSLKGKTIPIQGTNLILDTPEAVVAWIEERRRRWPSAMKVEEKKRKLQEAVERGQLTPLEAGLANGRKRQKTMQDEEFTGRGRGRGTGRGGRGRSRGWGAGSDAGWRGRGRGGGSTTLVGGRVASSITAEAEVEAPKTETVASTSKYLVLKDSISSSESEDEADDTAPPEAISSKAPPALPLPEKQLSDPVPAILSQAPFKKRPAVPKQPRPPAHNPFAPGRDLLRQLLLPEIRITISNLSQAIRFLVDNNFLEGVEVKPGERLIDVVDSSNSAHPQHQQESAGESAEECMDVVAITSQ